MGYGTTVGGWAALTVVVGGIYYFSGTNKKVNTERGKQTGRPVEAKKVGKVRKARRDGGQSGSDPGSKPSEKATKKKVKQVADNDETKASIATTSQYEPDEDEKNNKEFARQLSNAKAGTLLPSKTQEGGRQKSVKQSRAQEKQHAVETSSDATGPSSAAGGDADDDRSSFNSPDLAATSMESPVTNGGISDMLQAPASGPSILKVTAPTEPSPSKKAKVPTAFIPAETKKQRQNRKKAEEKKLMREEEEKERKRLEEKQRRTAREAEGRAAKDGSAFMAAKAPTNSVWTAPPAATNGDTAGKGETKRDLLDTYDSSSAKTVETVKPETKSSGSGWQNLAGGLSEEEQIRLALDDSDTWETVESKEAKRSKKKATLPVSAEKSEEKSEDNKRRPRVYQDNFEDPPLILPSMPGHNWGAELRHRQPNGEWAEHEVDMKDSEWEVAY